MDTFALTFVNQASCNYFRKSEEELIGLNLFALIPTSDQESVRQHIAALVEQRDPMIHEHQIINADGTVAWREWTDQPILDSQGQVMEIQATGYDIEARERKAEVIRNPRRYEYTHA